ncbi:hypothetical protein HNR12_004522 [Streptomonospora nanhaiensis]|uniref:Uncharacterized protein n=1 Tax=Streptomonospora nanhaiensis TaxID=1323731 RepID=A0A853BU29_9ACTN|nr:hypothetical protein [Streptomonospora nanhaiensis]
MPQIPEKRLRRRGRVPPNRCPAPASPGRQPWTGSGPLTTKLPSRRRRTPWNRPHQPQRPRPRPAPRHRGCPHNPTSLTSAAVRGATRNHGRSP